jgi:hypothetical protein
MRNAFLPLGIIRNSVPNAQGASPMRLGAPEPPARSSPDRDGSLPRFS